MALSDKMHKGKVVPSMNVLAFKEGKAHLAICLELDIATHGNSKQDALKSLAEMVQVQIEYAEENNTQLYRPAPKEFWQKLHELQADEVKQILTSHPPRSAKQIFRGIMPVNA